ncbi:bb33c7e3-5b88-43a2-9920-8cf825e56d4e [Thermothielavioides terrestris]|uniref:3-hydroxy-3-methylglutaryl coenzyme A reductase n=2 Tax=Thermothielavioides terrestris TaxID=2587410 RepID=G2RCC7_THETT|nr:3-hydroxy-3-methylglutaryl-CoA reductase [Thermothielavioides terrestris NRRL 8126]AEO70562.1 3-hydroxy-3-methylglutaryl-CoA reductase [Thermothielavioides terrestris NRRL 8126]SPQ18389.1 bb33c7e3-5b88-43a2-9920-8cf825e56d4e [Thermothielavioides terrestris]
MIASNFLPSRFRGEQPRSQNAAPSWLNKKITPLLQVLSRLTSTHPIQTIVVVALLASSSYIGLLEESLFDATTNVRKAEWSSLVEGSRLLRAGEDTAWTWQPCDTDAPIPPNADHLALLTLVFPESLSTDPSKAAPMASAVPMPQNLSIRALPSTSNSFTTYSQDSALVFSVPYDQAPEFLSLAQEIPNDIPSQEIRETEHGREKKMWIMKAARAQTRSSLARWARNAWVEFLDLLKAAETLDIIIMALGYISMHLTFVSLFVSMRGMGSNFWLATSVLFSSTFAFLFGLFVTTKLGVPISMVLLSEGLPFLVVTIGFEKNIVLTRAVLSHAIEHRRPEKGSGKGSKKADVPGSIIQSAIYVAIKEKGFGIVKDYAIEIGVLILGAASGVQGGLQQFCFLAAWILFFDCILLFSFYTAILCIKLEINRIKRHVEMRKALEDDGVSRRVAENVAQSNEWPGVDGADQPGTTIFGRQFKSTHIPKFKVIMVSGFFLVNALNLCAIPFRSANSISHISSWARGLGGVVTPPPVDPFKVASNGLDVVLEAARSEGRETIVTVLNPIRYELEFPSVHYDLPQNADKADEEGFADLAGYGVGGRMVGSILKSLEDPILSKWIVVALALSVALNGYLFNAARWGIKDPNVPDHPIDPKELAAAQRFNDTESATLPVGGYTRPPPSPPSVPPTPALTDDESEPAQSAALPGQAVPEQPVTIRSQEEMEKMLQEKRAHELNDEEVIALSMRGKIPGYALEKTLKDCTRAVKIRRTIISRTKATADLTGFLERSKLPYQNYNWAQVLGACCENVIGYMPLPVGVAGPLVIDGQSYFIPMATTEGVLVASTSRGCKAINSGGGAVTVLTADGMTRGPCVSFETLERAGAAKLWLDSEKGQSVMKKAFNSTSRFARLETMKTVLAGTNLYIRFKTTTGDAMGMNMISKGVEHALSVMMSEGFEDMNIVSVSGNYCTDKKPAAINWIDGRGKSVVAEAIIPAEVVKSVLKTDVDTMVELNVNKNLIGSAMAASVGGFNAHAANIVAAVFLATGQDPAQVVESANCITIMKNLHGSLQISVSMPSLEVGTLGGGTILEPQAAMLDMLGVRGPHPTSPGENARRLARIIAAAVLAGELSLCSALAAGHLVRAHMQHNRSAPPTRSTTPAPMTLVGGVDRAAGSTTALSAAAIERRRH